MKLFYTTIIARNSCYTETFVVVEETLEKAHATLEAHEGRKIDYNTAHYGGVSFRELPIGTTETTPSVHSLGLGDIDDRELIDD